MMPGAISRFAGHCDGGFNTALRKSLLFAGLLLFVGLLCQRQNLSRQFAAGAQQRRGQLCARTEDEPGNLADQLQAARAFTQLVDLLRGQRLLFQ